VEGKTMERSSGFIVFSILVAVLVVGTSFAAPAQRPEDVARAYMEAAKEGDTEGSLALMTEKAKQAAAETGFEAAEAGPGASFKVGVARVKGERADVPVTMILEGEEKAATLLMRREKGEWRIYGMKAPVGPGGPEMTMDFENPQAMMAEMTKVMAEAMKEGFEEGFKEAKPLVPELPEAVEEEEIPEVVWERTLMGAHEKAKEKVAPVLLYFCDTFGSTLCEKCPTSGAATLKWCCQSMEEGLRDPKIRKHLAYCINVKIPLDFKGEYEKIAVNYGVLGALDLEDRANLRVYYQHLIGAGAEWEGSTASGQVSNTSFRDVAHMHARERTILIFESADKQEILGKAAPRWTSGVALRQFEGRGMPGPGMRGPGPGPGPGPGMPGPGPGPGMRGPGAETRGPELGRQMLALPHLAQYIGHVVEPYEKFHAACQARDALKLEEGMSLFQEVSESLVAPVSLTEQAQAELAGFKNLIPRMVIRLEGLLAEENLLEANKLIRALRSKPELLSPEDGLKLEAAFNRLISLGEARLKQAEEKVAVGDLGGAKQLLGDLALQLPETEVASRARERIKQLERAEAAPGVGEAPTIGPTPTAVSPVGPEEAPEVEPPDEAEILLQQARSGEAAGNLVGAYKIYNDLVKRFPDHEAGKTAKRWLADLEKTPRRRRAILDKLAEDDCRVWMSFAKSYLDNKRYDNALSYYRKVVDTYPGTSFAEEANRQIAEIERQKR
jgi:tetratricopeptide (TPR) repeat protein